MSEDEKTMTERIALVSLKIVVKSRIRAAVRTIKKHSKMNEEQIKNYLYEIVDYAIKKEHGG